MQCQHIMLTRRFQNVSTLYKQKQRKHFPQHIERRSILVFCVLDPFIKLPRFSPGNQTIKSLTATFTPPLSAQTCDGAPHSFLLAEIR